MRHKHKVMVEVTFNKPMTARNAKFIIEEILACADKEKILGGMGWASAYDIEVQKIACKEGERAIKAVRN